MAAHSAQSLKDPECCSARGLNLWSPCLSGQTGTYPTELNWFLKDGSLRDHGLDGEEEISIYPNQRFNHLSNFKVPDLTAVFFGLLSSRIGRAELFQAAHCVQGSSVTDRAESWSQNLKLIFERLIRRSEEKGEEKGDFDNKRL
ncbi:uncharacterized protein [Porites lutea]|uniref:uncharacterized protein n=1 Tax=Porites lutea TaxID=51062 RepID=UPI003CC5FE3A